MPSCASFFGFTKATQPKNQRTKAHQPWQQLTPSACILVEHSACVALSVTTRTDNDGILILIVNLISHNFFFFSVCVFVRKGKPRAKRCFHMGRYYGMIFIVSGIWPKTTAKKLARKKHISSISCLTDEIGRTPLLEWWHSLVRFPNCIVYSWVYNTQKTVKIFFDGFHSLHLAMHWYKSIIIGKVRVSSPVSNWKNSFSFTQFKVTAILLPPPNL